jgi:hypothetical protein
MSSAQLQLQFSFLPHTRPLSRRWLDELVLACRDKLPSCSPDALSKVVSALPLLGQGYRLNQVVSQAQVSRRDTREWGERSGAVGADEFGVASVAGVFIATSNQ